MVHSLKRKLLIFFKNLEEIKEAENSASINELKTTINLSPKTEFKRLEETLAKVKQDNEMVGIENFKELYTLILKTNADIRKICLKTQKIEQMSRSFTKFDVKYLFDLGSMCESLALNQVQFVDIDEEQTVEGNDMRKKYLNPLSNDGGAESKVVL